MTSVARLRLVGVLEGISFLLLLFVAMPLKYFAGMPLAVRVVGLAHGLLFVAFVYQLFVTAADRGWSIGRSGAAFAAALLPFGPFVLDRRLAAEETSAASTDAGG